MNETVQEIAIGSATAADTGAIQSLLERSELPTDGLIDHLNEIIVARKRGEIVGSVALELYAGGALLRSLAVDSGERGAKLGHRLTEAAIARASELGTPALYLLTTTADASSPNSASSRSSGQMFPPAFRRRSSSDRHVPPVRS